MIGQNSCTYQFTQEVCSHQNCQNQIPFNCQGLLSYPSASSLLQSNICSSRRNPTPIGPPRSTFNPTIAPPSAQNQSQQQPQPPQQPQSQSQVQQNNQQQTITTASASYPAYPTAVSYMVPPPPPPPPQPPQPFNTVEFMRYYSMYNRFPMMPIQPVILHHPGNLQITHLNVATGFMPAGSSHSISSTGNGQQNNNGNGGTGGAAGSSTSIAFGPPPRDRKSAGVFDDDHGCEDQQRDNNCAGQDPCPAMDFLNPSGPVDLKYIESFCMQAERIALKNQHRPCFKNIQHLCNRTRSDIMKPNTTVANIHSQGIPWALKDFIFAFIRLVNATHILHGYVDYKAGSLGKIENHLTDEFKSSYQEWEKITKDQLIPAITKVIMDLDSLSNSSQQAAPKTAYCYQQHQPQQQQQQSSTVASGCSATSASLAPAIHFEARMKQLDLVPETVFSQRNPVPGLLRVNLHHDILGVSGGGAAVGSGCVKPASVSSTTGAAEVPLSDEDSDGDATYINPGTHKPLPRKSVYDKEAAAAAIREPAARDDKQWQSAIESIKQMQMIPAISGEDIKIFAEMETNPTMYSPQAVRASYLQVKEELDNSFLKISQQQQQQASQLPTPTSFDKSSAAAVDLLELNGRDVTETSESGSNDTTIGSLSPVVGNIKVALLKHHHQHHHHQHQQQQQDNDGNSSSSGSNKNNNTGGGNGNGGTTKKCIQSRTYRKRLDFDNGSNRNNQQQQQQQQQQLANNYGGSKLKKGLRHHHQQQQQQHGQTWEMRGGNNGLTDKAVKTFDKIVKDLAGTSFGKSVATEKCLLGKNLERPMSLENVTQKLWSNKYANLRQVVHDIRLIVRNGKSLIEQGKSDWIYEKELNVFAKKFNETIADYFRNMDFSDVTGSPEEVLHYPELGRSNNKNGRGGARILLTSSSSATNSSHQFDCEN